jgi:DNA polymerase I
MVTRECKILFDHLGVINCFPLYDFWDRLLDIGYCTDITETGDQECISLDSKLKILTYNPTSSLIETRSPSHIMRHKFVGDIVNIRTDYHNIRVTKNHSLIDIVEDQIIKVTPYDTDRIWYCSTKHELYPLRIREIYNEYYDGYVYDLEVPETHNFIINGILSHD